MHRVSRMWLQRLRNVSAVALKWTRQHRLFAGAVVLAVLLWVFRRYFQSRGLVAAPEKVELIKETDLANAPGVNGTNPVPTYQRRSLDARFERWKYGKFPVLSRFKFVSLEAELLCAWAMSSLHVWLFVWLCRVCYSNDLVCC